MLRIHQIFSWEEERWEGAGSRIGADVLLCAAIALPVVRPNSQHAWGASQVVIARPKSLESIDLISWLGGVIARVRQ